MTDDRFGPSMSPTVGAEGASSLLTCAAAKVGGDSRRAEAPEVRTGPRERSRAPTITRPIFRIEGCGRAGNWDRRKLLMSGRFRVVIWLLRGNSAGSSASREYPATKLCV